MSDQAVASAPPVTISTKDIPPQDRLIVALDVPTAERARELISRLGDAVTFYKLGLELFMAEGYFELVSELVAADKKVFVDLKFFDVPKTVESAVRQLNERKATFATVHGNDEIMEAACRAKNGLKILAVTILTSLDQGDIDELGLEGITIEQVALSRAGRALKIGCDGVISSGHEAAAVRQMHGDGLLIVVPGIRDEEDPKDDQKRFVGVEEAFLNGADYIVVGRPIRNAPDPSAAAQAIQDRIRRVLSAQP